MDNEIKKEFKVAFLHEHYQDTFKHLQGYMQKRDRYSFFIVLIVAALYLFSLDKTLFSEILNQLFNKWTGSKSGFDINYTIIHSTLLVMLLIYLLNYYRLINLISSQMSYIGDLEKKMNQLTEPDFIIRESGQYSKLPKFIRGVSRFMYKTGFPVLLIVLISYNVYYSTSVSYLDIIVTVIIILLTCFYFIDANKKLWKRS
ncbi:MAG: hypothetical protein AB8G11_13455 [Saprospiraceae bacterium]